MDNFENLVKATWKHHVAVGAASTALLFAKDKMSHKKGGSLTEMLVSFAGITVASMGVGYAMSEKKPDH